MIYCAPLPCRSTAACEKQVEVWDALCLDLEGMRKGAGPSWHGHRGTKHAYTTPGKGSFSWPGLTYFILLFHFFTYSPCVSVICTVSFKGVKEINSNPPFPLLIKVMTRKNGRQYQFIYHELCISSYAATDYLLVGLLICSWHYFCF